MRLFVKPASILSELGQVIIYKEVNSQVSFFLNSFKTLTGIRCQILENIFIDDLEMFFEID